MTDNFNSNPNYFVGSGNRINEGYANQTGDTTAADNTCCNCCNSFWCSDFAANLATAFGGVGSALVQAKMGKTNTPKTVVKPPSPPAAATTSTGKKVLYWTLGIVAVGGVIGAVMYFKKKS